ncbi:MAG: domain S-box-containing protein/diguanylate cyclase protein [Frankiales bacterium]|nr:domain S-box-containing protein/diguanylate cyclase protein [Frankiales bacterium]
MLPTITIDMTFEQAAHEALRYLRENVPMAFWSVTRVENGRQTYQYLDDNDYGLVAGQSHPWEDSFCVHMAAGTAPPVAPDAQAVPQYAAAGVNALAPIGAYAGSVIREADGRVFGAVCGLSPEASDDPRLAAAAPVLQLLGQLLTMVLAVDRQRDEAAARLAAAEVAAETDVLTGLHNRRAWERLLADQEDRFLRLGDPTVLAMLDLDMLKAVNDSQGHAAGDDYIRRAAVALRAAVREQDLTARLGGDEFGVLLVGCTEAEAEVRVAAIYEALEAAGVAGSVGWAPITVLRGLPAALAQADEAMYAAKRDRRSRRAGLPAPREERREQVQH